MMKRKQFSIRALLLATLATAVILATFRWIGNVLIFSVSGALCVWCAWRALRRATRWRSRLALALGSLFFGLTTSYLSIGPASWLLAQYHSPYVLRPKAEKVYSSLYIPIATTIIYAPPPARRAGMWYVAKWMPAGVEFHAEWPDGMGWTKRSAVDPRRGITYTVVHY